MHTCMLYSYIMLSYDLCNHGLLNKPYMAKSA